MSKKIEGACSETKDQILNIATRLFACAGLNGVSIRKICEASSSNLASVSYHFGGKRKLYTQCLKAIALKEEELTLCFQTPAKEKDLHDTLEGFCLSLCHLISENPEVIRLAIQDLNANFGKNSLDQVFFVSLNKKLSSYLESGVKEGFLSSDLRPDVAARFLIGGLIFHKLFFQSSESAPDKEIVSQLIRSSTWSTYA